VAVLLGLAAVDVLVAGLGAVVALAVLARWGTTSLPALAGLQSVVGPAGLRGSGVEAASSWLAAAALVVVAGALPRRWPAVALGLTAALVVAGPAASRPADAAVRVGGAVAGAALATAVAGRLPTRLAYASAAVLAGASLVLAVLP
jgi:hypothetical protein